MQKQYVPLGKYPAVPKKKYKWNICDTHKNHMKRKKLVSIGDSPWDSPGDFPRDSQRSDFYKLIKARFTIKIVNRDFNGEMPGGLIPLQTAQFP